MQPLYYGGICVLGLSCIYIYLLLCYVQSHWQCPVIVYVVSVLEFVEAYKIKLRNEACCKVDVIWNLSFLNVVFY